MCVHTHTHTLTNMYTQYTQIQQYHHADNPITMSRQKICHCLLFHLQTYLLKKKKNPKTSLPYQKAIPLTMPVEPRQKLQAVPDEQAGRCTFLDLHTCQLRWHTMICHVYMVQYITTLSGFKGTPLFAGHSWQHCTFHDCHHLHTMTNGSEALNKKKTHQKIRNTKTSFYKSIWIIVPQRWG